MNSRPPGEGARWGDDPQPKPEPSAPQHPPQYLRLCKQFGEQNTQRAVQLQNHIRHNYPHLRITQIDPLEFAADALEFARAQMDYAARDGRPHSMPETLKILEDLLGGALAENPDQTRIPRGLNLTFGDERKGRAATKTHNDAVKKKEMLANMKSYGQGVFLAAIPGTIAGVESSSLGVFFLVTAGAFGLLIIIGLIAALFED